MITPLYMHNIVKQLIINMTVIVLRKQWLNVRI